MSAFIQKNIYVEDAMSGSNSWSRRNVLKSSLALAGMGATGLFPGAASALGSLKLGASDITVISDGNLMLPLSFAFPDVSQDELVALLKAEGQPTDALLPDCNITVLRRGDRVVMFDVGAGPNFMPSAGKLMDNIDAAGVSPDEVTDIVFTHAHPDHLWGLIDDFDELIFADARYHMNRIEWEYWQAEDTLEKTPDARKSFVVGARNRMAFLEDRIELFDYDAEVVPGVEAVDTAGHTPGHTSFMIHDGSNSALVVGDAITNVAVSLIHPEWPSGSDQDAEKGIATRKMLLDRLAVDGSRIIGFHMPHPGLGVIERARPAYRFVVAG
ncbi:MAG: MBL fold metallo-hydrolase [Thalassospira sp.]|nr:MBL fold metallo-hydrolase [Thalassospira sp.]QPO13535.1 MBL fold metallo-hydrolase [Thalassospira sp. A40-3]